MLVHTVFSDLLIKQYNKQFLRLYYDWRTREVTFQTAHVIDGCHDDVQLHLHVPFTDGIG